jgi:hypothetical protein
MSAPRQKETFLIRYAKNFEYLFKALAFIPAIIKGTNKVVQVVFPPLARFFNGLSELAKEATGPIKYFYQAVNIAFIGLAILAAATALPSLLSIASWIAAGLTTLSWVKNTVIPAMHARSAYFAEKEHPTGKLKELAEEYNQAISDVKWGLLTVVGMSMLSLSTIVLIAASTGSLLLPIVGLGGTSLLVLTASRAEIISFARSVGSSILPDNTFKKPISQQNDLTNSSSQTSILAKILSPTPTKSPADKPLQKTESQPPLSFFSEPNSEPNVPENKNSPVVEKAKALGKTPSS